MSWNTEATKKAKKQAIQDALARSDVFVVKALKEIYARQTWSEKSAGATMHLNGIGFSGRDSVILSSFAKQVEAWESTPEGQRRFASPLSPKQMATARKLMPKYWAQLIQVADEKAKAPVLAQVSLLPQEQAGAEAECYQEPGPVYYLDGEDGCDSGSVWADAQETPQGF